MRYIYVLRLEGKKVKMTTMMTVYDPLKLCIETSEDVHLTFQF